MKSTSSFLSLLCLTGLLLLLNACRKNTEHLFLINNSQKGIPDKVYDWLNRQEPLAMADSGKATVRLVRKNLDMAALRTEKLNDSERMVIIPLSAGFQSTHNTGNHPANYLFLILNPRDDIRRGNILQYVADEGHSRSLPVNALHSMFNHEKMEENGLFSFRNLVDHFEYSFSYAGGNLFSYSRNQAQSRHSSSSGRVVTDSGTWYDLYLVTTYYYTDGSIEQTEQYLGTYCIGCDVGGSGGSGGSGDAGASGGSGGDGGLFTPQQDDDWVPVNKAVQWQVASAQAWAVYSYETLYGQKSPSNSAIGYFTSATHDNSSVVNLLQPGLATWTELQANIHVDPAAAAVVRGEVHGKITSTITSDIKVDGYKG